MRRGSTKKLIESLKIQHGGSHYKKLAIQPVEFIAANQWDYFAGNSLKYLTRWRSKNGIEDLVKGKHYVELRRDVWVPYQGGRLVRVIEGIRRWKLRPISMDEYVEKNQIPQEEQHLFFALDEWVRYNDDPIWLIESLSNFIEKKRSYFSSFCHD